MFVKSIVTFAKKLTVDQWRALEDQYTPKQPPPETDRWKVLGLYLLFALVLLISNYVSRGSEPFATLFPGLSKQPDAPIYQRLWWAWSLVGFYVIPGWLYARFVLKMTLKDLGLDPRGFVRHAWIYLGAFAVVFPLLVLVSARPDFQNTYPFTAELARDWGTLLIWEVSYAAQFVALEFFFRGVMLFGPARVLGPWAIIAMAVPYMAIHFRKPPLEAAGAIVAATALGTISMRTRSVYPGMVIHIGVAWSMDLLALWRKGQLEALLSGAT